MQCWTEKQQRTNLDKSSGKTLFNRVCRGHDRQLALTVADDLQTARLLSSTERLKRRGLPCKPTSIYQTKISAQLLNLEKLVSSLSLAVTI